MQLFKKKQPTDKPNALEDLSHKTVKSILISIAAVRFRNDVDRMSNSELLGAISNELKRSSNDHTSTN